MWEIYYWTREGVEEEGGIDGLSALMDMSDKDYVTRNAGYLGSYEGADDAHEDIVELEKTVKVAAYGYYDTNSGRWE